MTAASLLFPTLRGLARVCPPPLLLALVWPPLAVLGLVRACGAGGRQWRRRMAAAGHGRPGLFRSWRRAVDHLFVRMADLWPDMFLRSPWRDRVSFTGLDEVQSMLDAKTPVVCVVLHFNHLPLLRHLLRSRALPAASLVAWHRETSLSMLADAAADAAGGLRGIRTLFTTPAEMRQGYHFLRSGNCLIVAGDMPSERHVTIDTDFGTLRLALGPLLLARMAGGCVVPAIHWQSHPWRLHVSFGPPLIPAPESDANGDRRLAEACVAHWLPVLRERFEQYDWVGASVWSSPARHADAPA